MRTKDKIATLGVMVMSSAIAFFSGIQINHTTAHNLMILSVAIFIFYLATMIILNNSRYTKRLYNQIKNDKRDTHVLRSYMVIIGYWSIISMITVILFRMIPSYILVGIIARNVFHMLFLTATTIDVILEGAKK